MLNYKLNENNKEKFLLKKKKLNELKWRLDMRKCKLKEKLKELKTKLILMLKDKLNKKNKDNIMNNLSKLNKSEINKNNLILLNLLLTKLLSMNFLMINKLNIWPKIFNYIM